MILKEFPNYNYLSGDAISSANRKLISKKTVDGSEINQIELYPISDLEKNIIKYSVDFEKDLRFILDSSFIDVENIHDVDANNYLIIALGFPDISLQEGLDNLNKYDTEDDWTYIESDFKKEMFMKSYINQSKQMQKDCQKYNIKFINTSYNRQNVLSDAYKWLKDNINN